MKTTTRRAMPTASVNQELIRALSYCEALLLEWGEVEEAANARRQIELLEAEACRDAANRMEPQPVRVS